MENSSLHWQDSLNPQLLQRLVLLGQQPGIIKRDIGQKIIERCDRFLNRLPLLSQYLQRWQGFNEMSVDSLPIVYALPSLPDSGNTEKITVNQVNHLASNTEKTIETKIESSQLPSVSVPYSTEKKEFITNNPRVAQESIVNEMASPIEMPLSTPSNSVMPLQESGKNKNVTVKAIATSSTPIGAKSRSENSESIGNDSPNKEFITNNPRVVQGSTVNEISSPIEMPLSTPSNSVMLLQESGKNENVTVKAIATSSTPIGAKSRSKNGESTGNDSPNNVSLSPYQTVHPLSIIDNFLSSEQTHFLINQDLNKKEPLPIAQILARNSNDVDRPHLIVNPVRETPWSYKDSFELLLSQNKSAQEDGLSRPLSLTHSSLVNYANQEDSLNRPLSLTNPSLVNYAKNTPPVSNYLAEEVITENLLVPTTRLEQKLDPQKVKLPVVKVTNQSPPEKLENQLPLSSATPSPMVRITPQTKDDRPAIANPLPLVARNPSLSSSTNFEIQRRSPQQSPEVPKVFAALSPPTETTISPLQTTPPKVNLDAIADQVERKIMRRLVIESERRGQKR